MSKARFCGFKFCCCFFSFKIQAKEFIKVDWLKRVVFQPNSKYLHEGISFAWQQVPKCHSRYYVY